MDRILLLCLATVAAIVALGGCGAGSAGPGDAGVGLMDKIVEYVGDGGGGMKPLPPFLSEPAAMTKTVGEVLGIGAVGLVRTVPAKGTSWFQLPPRATAQTVVVTLQPTADEDADLYVLSRIGYASLGMSTRSPNGSKPDRMRGGYAPDWVAVDLTASNGYPMAHVAVYGVGSGTGTKHFRLEADKAQILGGAGGTVNGTLKAKQSRWYRLNVYGGDPYNLYLTAVSGDPDLFVYQQNSGGWVGSDVNVGNGAVSFTAGSGPYYIRVLGYSATEYSLWIQDV